MRLECPGFSGLVIAHSRHDSHSICERIGDSEKAASGFSNDKSASRLRLPNPSFGGPPACSSLDPNGPKAPNRPYHQSIFTALSMAVSMPSMNSSISASDCIAFLNRFRLASSKEI